MNRYAVVLAAGKGTRMKSNLYKVMHPVMGKPMVGHVVDAARHANIDDVVTITGFGSEVVKDYLGNRSQYALQEEQLGTAHAVMQAKNLLQGKKGVTVVLSGDTPLLTSETLSQALDHHERVGAKVTVLTAHAENPYGYGRVIREQDGSVSKIVEQKDANESEQAVQEINTGTYCFDNQLLFDTLDQVDNNNAQGEYYLPDVVEILKNQGQFISAYQLDSMSEALGVNDRVALSKATEFMRQRINEKHMRNGVTIQDPTSTYIENDVQIDSDTVIEPGVYLRGKTRIGKDCLITAHSDIKNSKIEDKVVIKQSTLQEAVVGKDSDVGPYSHLRPNTQLGEKVHIGNFVEVKKSSLAKGSKAGHHSYIGDAQVGENVNIGCGVIIANYDGENKHQTIVRDDVFIGSNATIVAPVEIQSASFIAAGSTINKDVPSESLAIARAKQEIKEGYANKLPYSKKNKSN